MKSLDLQLHTFPEGKVCQEDAPIRRLKWGTASLIDRAPVTPIVLPIVHRGLEEVSFSLIYVHLSSKKYFKEKGFKVFLCLVH